MPLKEFQYQVTSKVDASKGRSCLRITAQHSSVKLSIAREAHTWVVVSLVERVSPVASAALKAHEIHTHTRTHAQTSTPYATQDIYTSPGDCSRGKTDKW